MNHIEGRKRITEIAIDPDVARITVVGVLDSPGIAAALFEPLVEQGVNVDIVVQNAGAERTTDLSFTVKGTDLDRAVATVRTVMDAVGAREVLSQDGLAKVSVVGAGMLDAPGYAARMFRALADAGINIEMITTSGIRITCVVKLDDAAKAAQVLRTAFDLEVA